MVATDLYARLPCSEIIISAGRQRTEIDTSDLKPSIEKRGVLVPILITQENILVAGERRLTASLELGLPDIPCRYVQPDLSFADLQIIELEENLKRADLSWIDQVNAIGRLQKHYLDADPSHTATRLSELLGFSSNWITKSLRVHAEIADPKVLAMPHLNAAYNFLTRKDERGVANAMTLIREVGLTLGVRMEKPKVTEQAPNPPTLSSIPVADVAAIIEHLPKFKPKELPDILPAAESLLNANFLSWAPSYSDQKFNFCHCDFPYGVGVFDGKKSGHERAEHTYDDEAGTFWKLVDCLIANRNTLFQASCHLMFWFSMDYYTPLIERFQKQAPEFIVNPFPLIWHKSDGSGITPDPKRGGKRTYETALVFTRGDRFVVRSIGNLYSAPTDKRYHVSTKPEPMLRHFMQLFVDEHCRMLDPTAGSASSLRAAESLGAEHVFGLERDEAIHKGACEALWNFRVLAAGSKRV